MYALAFWYGGQLVAWQQATFGDVLKVPPPRAMSPITTHLSIAAKAK